MDESILIVFYVASGLYALLLLTAAVFDTCKFIIPNAITIALVGLFIVAALLSPFDMGWRDWLSHIGAAAAVLAGGAVLFAFNVLGGGDVKLLTAVSFWAGFDYLLDLMLLVSVGGGALALGLIILRRILLSLGTALPGFEKIKLPRVLVSGEAVPYALAIVPSSIYIGMNFPQLGVDFWL